MLTTNELRNLARRGIEIGAHSMTHPELDILDPTAAMAEIGGSRRVLEDILGVPVRSFAYPHGYNSPQTRGLVERAGFRSAVRVRHAQSEWNECRFGLSRLIITEDLGPDRFMALIAGTATVVAPPQDRLVARIWRSTRRLRHWRDQLVLAG